MRAAIPLNKVRGQRGLDINGKTMTLCFDPKACRNAAGAAGGVSVSVPVVVVPLARFTVEGCREQVYPMGKFPLQERVTGLGLFVAGTTLICSVPDWPAVILKGVLGMLRLKSGMTTVMRSLIDSDPA